MERLELTIGDRANVNNAAPANGVHAWPYASFDNSIFIMQRNQPTCGGFGSRGS